MEYVLGAVAFLACAGALYWFVLRKDKKFNKAVDKIKDKLED